jgi:death-on-curing protein
VTPAVRDWFFADEAWHLPGLVSFEDVDVDAIIFLTLEQVEDIHRQQLRAHGGQDGYISKSVVESAIAQPAQTMFGEYLHMDLAHMAAAYLYHLATTQGFMDGNKRTALMCAITFLKLNGYTVRADAPAVYDVVMAVVTNEMTKDQLVEWFGEQLQPVE